MTEKKSYRTVEKFLRGALIVIAACFWCCNVYVRVARHVFKISAPAVHNGIVDAENNVVVPLEYDDISIFCNGVAYAIKDGTVVILQLT